MTTNKPFHQTGLIAWLSINLSWLALFLINNYRDRYGYVSEVESGFCAVLYIILTLVNSFMAAQIIRNLAWRWLGLSNPVDRITAFAEWAGRENEARPIEEPCEVRVFRVVSSGRWLAAARGLSRNTIVVDGASREEALAQLTAMMGWLWSAAPRS
jgi:hypothetical protein